MSSTILDYLSVWPSECPSDEEIGLSDCSYDRPELAVLEQLTGTLIASAGTESRALRAAGSSVLVVRQTVVLLVIPQAAALVVRQTVVFLVRPPLKLSECVYQKRPFLITHFLVTFLLS